MGIRLVSIVVDLLLAANLDPRERGSDSREYYSRRLIGESAAKQSPRRRQLGRLLIRKVFLAIQKCLTIART